MAHRGYGGSRRGGYRGRGSKSAPKPRGQVKSNKAVQYSIRDRGGNVKYIGGTNNPRYRAAEHRQSGKMSRGDRLVVETRPLERRVAERVESAKLRSYRAARGRNPRHNATSNGQYQPRLFG